MLPVLGLLPDGSYRSVLLAPRIAGRKREALLEPAGRGDDLDGGQARYVRVIEYEIPDRDGEDELIALVTTITDLRLAPAAELARAYHQRWEHEGGNAQLKTYLRGPRVNHGAGTFVTQEKQLRVPDLAYIQGRLPPRPPTCSAHGGSWSGSGNAGGAP